MGLCILSPGKMLIFYFSRQTTWFNLGYGSDLPSLGYDLVSVLFQSLCSAICVCPMSDACCHLGASCGLRGCGVRGSDSYTYSLGVGPKFMSNFMDLLF